LVMKVRRRERDRFPTTNGVKVNGFK